MWVWHPRTSRQTLVFATPANDGWRFLWSPRGQGNGRRPGGHVRGAAPYARRAQRGVSAE
ncbi:hypothetical protein [Nonomuraea salmonea]|uniref:hypothetical protein n=1 Tax=Nonomuraea salmonea TaxID=46181 RepID=UPI0031E568BF